MSDAEILEQEGVVENEDEDGGVHIEEEDEDEMLEEGEEEDEHAQERFTFFSEVSMQELAFGIGTVGVNCLCIGMMLNIPTLKLHQLMYATAPLGLLDKSSRDVERVGVAKAIIDYWRERTASLKPKKRFLQLYEIFKVYLREHEIAEELKTKFEADEPISLECFVKFDLGRLGPYIPPSQVEFKRHGGEEYYG